MNSTIIQFLTSYLSQSAWAVILWVIFGYFYRVYNKQYLVYWSWSWAAYAMYAFFAGLGLYASQDYASDHYVRVFFTTLSLAGAYQQVYWLLVGTYVLSYKRSLSRRVILWLPLTILLFSLFISLAFNFDPDAGFQRIILRVGVKSIVFSIIFTTSASILLRNKVKEFYLGRRIVILSFYLFGISQLFYFLYVIDVLPNYEFWLQVTQSISVMDSLTLSMIGLGTIIWLLEEERQELEKTNKNLDSFLYSTSHDLRAPVASLLGLINVAKHDIKEEAGQQYLKMMQERVTKLDEIFKDILAYSRASKGTVTKEIVDFNQLLDQVIGEVKFHEGANDIRLIYEPNPQFTLYSDPIQLKIILGNLISNSVKYHDTTKKDQYIKVIFERWDRDIMITLEDNGLGIPKESLDKIFNMFYRAHNYATGSGLGLFIVKEAIDKLEGDISVESEEQKGTLFYIRLKDADPQLHFPEV